MHDYVKTRKNTPKMDFAIQCLGRRAKNPLFLLCLKKKSWHFFLRVRKKKNCEAGSYAQIRKFGYVDIARVEICTDYVKSSS